VRRQQDPLEGYGHLPLGGPLAHTMVGNVTVRSAREALRKMEVHMPIDLPLGPAWVILPDDPADSAQQVAAALTTWQAGRLTAQAYRAELTRIAAHFPTCLSVWAALGELTLPEDVITAYAYFRTGYHRGLDRARASGWRGTQQLRWEHESNRGFLRCLYGLLCAAKAIGEEPEVTRIRHFLLDVDPANHFGLGQEE
jgi:hypothetical protein